MDNTVSKRWAFRPSKGHLNIKQTEPAWAAATSCAYGKIHNFLRLLAVRFSTSCGQIFNFLRLLAVRLSTSCVSNVLAGNPQKQDIFTSCDSLRVLAAQEVLALLLARALFLGCTVYTTSSTKLLNCISCLPNCEHPFSLMRHHSIFHQEKRKQKTYDCGG